MASVTLPVEPGDILFAAAAATWLARFHAGTSAAVSDGSITLKSQSLSELEIERLWRVALLNEQDHSEQGESRLQLLAELMA